MDKTELYHFGVKGMKWGVRRKLRTANKERRKLIDDAKTIKTKANPGTTKMIYGNYIQKRNGRVFIASHIVDEFGKVKLSYINGADGDRYIAAGKDYIDKHIKLSDYFRNTRNMKIEYDVYD